MCTKFATLDTVFNSGNGESPWRIVFEEKYCLTTKVITALKYLRCSKAFRRAMIAARSVTESEPIKVEVSEPMTQSSLSANRAKT
jgi:hypothetical protein